MVKKRSKKKSIKKVKKKKDEYKVKVVDLKNKSRSGKYIRVSKKGKTRYYKYKIGIPINEYMKAFEGKIKIKRWGVEGKKGKKKADIYVEKIRKRPSIDKIIRKGITRVAISNLRLIDAEKVKTAYKEVLKPLVKDEELLEILSQRENIEKIKRRLEYRISFSGENGEEILVMKVFGKTLDQVKSDIIGEIIVNHIGREGIIDLRKKGYQIINVKGELGGYDGKAENIKTVKVNMTFVKGK